jgi:hypothetical protein
MAGAIEGYRAMSKSGKRAAGAAVAGAAGSASARRLRKLELRLASAREIEAKRTRQAEKAHARGSARDVELKRRRQLDKARGRAAEIEAELASLRDAALPGPSAYCLRERRTVDMVAPATITMRNGRAGIAGTCPSCGARVVRPG